jgi:hypothetical protein
MKQEAMKMATNDTMRPKTIADLETLLRLGQDIARIEITAPIAAQILEKWNDGNRRLDQITVQRYRRDMEASPSKWLADGEIGFGALLEGTELGNGQHRMAAQVASGTTQRYHARVFTDSDQYGVYVLTSDGGRGRSLADHLKVFGITSSPGDSAAFEQVVNSMQAFLGAKPGRLSKQERMDFALPRVKEVRYALALPKKQFKAHVRAAIAFAYGKRPKPVDEMISRVISGADLRQSSPELVFSKALDELNSARGVKEKDRAMGRTVRAIYDGITGAKRTAVSRAAFNSDAMIRAITELVSKAAAEAWLERHQS